MTGHRGTASAWAVGLLLVGLGGVSCTPQEQGEPEPQPYSGPHVLMERARLLEVDAQQRFLLFTQDGDTFVRPLPEGTPVRIANTATRAILASDGRAVLLWGAQRVDVSTRSVWLWRPGTDAAILLSSQVRGEVSFDGPLSFIAYRDLEGDGRSSPLRVVRTDACTAEACPVWTPLPGASDSLQQTVGTSHLLVWEGTQARLIDVPSGTVTDVGTTVLPPGLSADGTRYALFDAEDHLQVFDTATRTLQWEQVWRDEATRKDWHVANAFFTADGHAVLNISSGPDGISPNQTDSVVCDATGCRDVDGGICRNWELAPGALLCLMNPCPGMDCHQPARTYLDATGRTIASVLADSQSVSPVFSAGLRDQAWVERMNDTSTLWWKRADSTTSSVSLKSGIDSQLFTFTPDARRLVFAQRLTDADGKLVYHVSAWDGQTVFYMGRLDAPYPALIHPTVRDNPLTLYMGVAVGQNPASILRIPL